jgi:hypothetical protein
VVIPLSGRVPGRASGPSQSRVDNDDNSRYVSRKVVVPLGFSHRGEYIGRGAASGSGPGGLLCACLCETKVLDEVIYCIFVHNLVN